MFETGKTSDKDGRKNAAHQFLAVTTITIDHLGISNAHPGN